MRTDLEVTPAWAKQELEAGRLVLVDVRTNEEFACSRVAGSIHVPLHELERRLDEIEVGPGQSLATLCHHGVRSMKAALLLRASGHPGTMSVIGGIEWWSRSADAGVPRYERDGPICRVLPPMA